MKIMSNCTHWNNLYDNLSQSDIVLRSKKLSPFTLPLIIVSKLHFYSEWANICHSLAFHRPPYAILSYWWQMPGFPANFPGLRLPTVLKSEVDFEHWSWIHVAICTVYCGSVAMYCTVYTFDIDPGIVSAMRNCWCIYRCVQGWILCTVWWPDSVQKSC